MKLKLSDNQRQNLGRAGLFSCLAILIVFLYPTEDAFKYQFEIGKPWSYELITASFDFPIYKNDQQIAKEKEEILSDYSPFYKIDTTVANKQFEKLISDLQKRGESSSKIPNYIKAKFKNIYSTGIISVEQYNKLISEKRDYISRIQPNRVTDKIQLANIYTPKTAYKEIVDNAPISLKAYDINLYVSENLTYDSLTSEISKADLLKDLSLTSGMIQSGERIIDRGEIVTPTSYQILKSLKIETEKRKTTIQRSSIVLIGEIFMTMGLITLFFLYIYLFRPRI